MCAAHRNKAMLVPSESAEDMYADGGLGAIRLGKTTKQSCPKIVPGEQFSMAAIIVATTS